MAGDPPIEADVSANADNKAYVLGNHTFGFDQLVPTQIAQIFNEANYTAAPGLNDDRSAILDKLPTYSAFYIYTHANQDGFGDCYDDSNGTLVGYDDVGTAVANKSVYEPPYNIVFIDGCESAGYGSPSPDGESSFGISGQDRAFVGWDTFIWATLNTTWTQDFWINMANGETVYDAVVDSTAANGSPVGATSNEFIPQFVSPIIQGDNSMTLHGVYLGSGATQWFRAHLH